MNVASIPAVPGARHRRKRVGRGIGSGHGKTSTRGQKGQRSRTGSRKRPGFEGGRNPLIRRLPKRGFRQKQKQRSLPVLIVNIRQFNECQDGERLTLERMRQLGLIQKRAGIVKLLGQGPLTKRVNVSVHRVSESAKAQVVKAGGLVELIA